ncbi:MAG: DUF805 domain-containing protein [Hyphomicrobium sp.]
MKGLVMSASNLLRYFYHFEGRIGRQNYWIGTLVVLSVAVLAYFPYAALWKTYGRSFVVLVYVVFAIIFFALWPGIALGVKRLHDRNKSGLWLIPLYWVPTVLDKLNAKLDDGTFLWWITLGGSLILSLWCLVELGFLPGSPGANDFGQAERVVEANSPDTEAHN